MLSPEARADGVLCVALIAAFLALYAATSAPSLLWSDAAELQAVALTGGIAHPSGYPLFVMLGRVAGAVPLGEPARRITLMSALFGACAVGGAYALARRIVASRAAAASAAILYGASFTFWWASIGPEVYTLAVLVFLAALWRSDVATRAPTPGACFGAAFFLGLSLVGHLTFAPAVLVIACVLVARTVRAPRCWVALACGLVVGLLPYAYIPLADHAGVRVNYLAYTIEPAAGQFGLSAAAFDSPWEKLAYMFTGHDSNPGYAWAPRAIVSNAVHALVTLGAFDLGPIGASLGVAGAILALRRRNAGLAALLVASVVASGAFAVLNDSDRLRPIFLIPCTLSLALLAALGLEAIGARAQHGLLVVLLLAGAGAALPHVLRDAARRTPGGLAGYRMGVKDPPEIETLVPSLRGFTWPRAYGERVLALAPPNAMVIGKWKEITILLYLQSVDGLRRDLTLEPYDAAHRVRLVRWQRAHDLRTHPFAMLTRVAELANDFADADSVRVNDRYRLYVKRTPIAE